MTDAERENTISSSSNDPCRSGDDSDRCSSSRVRNRGTGDDSDRCNSSRRVRNSGAACDYLSRSADGISDHHALAVHDEGYAAAIRL